MQIKRATLFRILLAAFLSAPISYVAAQDSLSSFEQALSDSGWTVKRDADGSLVLIPRGSSATDSTTDQWQKMREQLQAAGWSVDREADGTLLLIPPSQAAVTSPEPVDPMQDIKKKLRETGWTVSTSDDGSMLLYPPRQSPPGKPAAVAGTPPLAQITLPVDSWQEAYDIAQRWLESQPAFGATLGKIRQVFRVYLVSIVSESAPHHLLQQIAIRTSDGSVIVLN